MRIRYSMIGGGPGSFIGAVHRRAAWLDGGFELVGGAFSSDPERSRSTGNELGLAPERVHGRYEDLLHDEVSRDVSERIHAVSIVTPNHMHAAPTMMAMEMGFHVIVDKPLAFSLSEAQEIEAVMRKTGKILALTHTYAGYPMVKEARSRIQAGALGSLRKVYVEYPQGWLSTFLESEGNRQAGWRTDPVRSGAGGSVGDIGTHAAHLAEYVTGLKITEVCAELNTVVKGRKLDDDVAALLHFEQQVTGVLTATQIAAGEENAVKIRVYGEKGGLEWSHSDPNTLLFKPLDGPVQVLRSGMGYLSEAAARATRLPAGHPEGYIEAFSNLYTAFGQAVIAESVGTFSAITDYDFPSIEEGLRGMAFIETMIASSKSSEKWTKLIL
jgi:predicted dehydrogenase